MTLSDLTDKLQSLCNEGLSDVKLTIDDHEEIEIENKPNQRTINIRKAHNGKHSLRTRI